MPGKELVPRPAVQPPAVTVPPWQQSAAGETVPAWRWLWRRRHWTVPLGLLPALWLAALGLHDFHLFAYVVVPGLLVTAFVAVLAFGASIINSRPGVDRSVPQKWDRLAEQVYATGSALCLWIWLMVGASLGPAHFWPTVGLAAAVAVWGFFWYRHKRPRGYRRRKKLVTRWDGWWQSHCWNWNLGGSKVIGVWPMGVTTKLRVQGIPGRHSIQHVNQVLHLIESGADGHADIGMIRAEAVKGKPSQFDLYLKRENPLRQIVEYDAALAPRSVHDLYPAGLTETGTWKTIALRRNRFTIGETRSGKSNDLLVGLAALTGCSDGIQVLIDLKGGRSARPVLEAAAVAYVVTEVDEARMLERMLVAEIRARAKYAYTGEEQLLATNEVPAWHLLIDEIHGLTSVPAGDAECAQLTGDVASLGNGLEVYEWIYTQHGSLEESVRTEQTRGNLPCRTVYRVAEARHGAYAIPEYNKLDASKLEEKGTCYIKDGPKALAEQVRAPKMSHPLLRKIATQNARTVNRPPLRLYCGNEAAYGDVTWQQWWDSRWGRLDPAFHEISPQYQEWVAMSAARSPAEAFAAGQEIRATVEEETIPASAPGEGDAKSAATRIADELERVHRGVDPEAIPPRVKLAPVIAANKEAFATALESARGSGISPTQLMQESRMASSWTYQTLSRLVDLGVATKLGRGRYVAVPGQDVTAALAAIEARNDELLREAKETVNAG